MLNMERRKDTERVEVSFANTADSFTTDEENHAR